MQTEKRVMFVILTFILAVAVFNIVDESLIQNTIAANELTPATARRVAGHIQSAEEAGADVILVTCSSIGPAVEAARPFVNVTCCGWTNPWPTLRSFPLFYCAGWFANT